ncbi:MAG TPA: zinc ribbon domain-containing protein [Candidatus Anaerofilum faecale]|nr:zinc ribbon domain-containing protein [Candidatus Anaerofilum faecale]
MFCMKCGADLGANPPPFCPQCGAAQDVTAVELPMKWFKFVIYVQLFASAVVNLYNAFSYLSGMFAESLAAGMLTAQELYAYMPGLGALLTVLGILHIGAAVFSIVVRQWLAHHQWRGVLGLYAVCAIQIVINVITMVGLLILNASAQAAVALLPGVITVVVMIILNKIYFDKRRSLFR